MREAHWLNDRTRTQVRECIKRIEAQTSAELVVTVQRTSGHYRHADYLVGAILALASLGFYFLYPEPIFDDIAALIIVASFGIGAILSASWNSLRSLLITKKLKHRNVQVAAKASFVEQGISQTRDRTGILVYVSLFEQRVEVVADCGVPLAKLEARWTNAVSAIDTSSRKGVDAFIRALDSLAPVLAQSLPRAADDINELPDEMVQA